MVNRNRIHEVIDLLPNGNNLSELLSQLNIALIYDEYTTRDGYSYMGNIAIKKNLGFKDRMFVICHEIGHVLMHSTISLFSFSKVNTEKENEANYFACLLLRKFGYDECIPYEMKHILESSTYPR